jgi:hypothetical protein
MESTLVLPGVPLSPVIPAFSALSLPLLHAERENERKIKIRRLERHETPFTEESLRFVLI